LPFPGKRELKYNFPGIPGIPGIDFYFIKLENGHFKKKKKMQYWLTLYGAPRLLTRDFMHLIVDYF
jgi:hypothetical protein